MQKPKYSNMNLNRKLFTRAKYNAGDMQYDETGQRLVCFASNMRINPRPLNTADDVSETYEFTDYANTMMAISIISPTTGTNALFRFKERNADAGIDYYEPMKNEIRKSGLILEYHYNA